MAQAALACTRAYLADSLEAMRGSYNEAAVGELLAHMQTELRRRGAHIDDSRDSRDYPSHPERKVGIYARASSWRKPAPGTIIHLQAHRPVDLARSMLIGDRESDLAAADAVGLEDVRFDAGALDQALADLAWPAPTAGAIDAA